VAHAINVDGSMPSVLNGVRKKVYKEVVKTLSARNRLITASPQGAVAHDEDWPDPTVFQWSRSHRKIRITQWSLPWPLAVRWMVESAPSPCREKVIGVTASRSSPLHTKDDNSKC
jgi:hypothetical protein